MVSPKKDLRVCGFLSIQSVKFGSAVVATDPQPYLVITGTSRQYPVVIIVCPFQRYNLVSKNVNIGNIFWAKGGGSNRLTSWVIGCSY